MGAVYPKTLDMIPDPKERELREKKAHQRIQEYLKVLKPEWSGGYDVRIKLFTRTGLLMGLAEQYYILGDTENEIKYLRWLIRDVRNEIQETKDLPDEKIGTIMFRFRRAHVLLAPHEFTAFLKVMEWDFPPEHKFYANRICVMKDWARDLERLEFGEYDILGLSAPPRSGKTGIGTLFVLWLMGRHPEKSMTFNTHTSRMARKEYQDILNLLSDPRRCWHEVFRGYTVEKSAEDLWIDILPKSAPNNYKTLYLSSIDANKAGVMEASWLIYCDDLIGGIEEAMNPARLDTAWEKYTTDILQRKNGNVKILHIATRWSVRDPLTRVEASNEDNPRARFIRVPGLDENGKSNFNFAYNPLDERHFNMLRESMDEVSFSCIVQQTPVERDGIVFQSDSLSYYDGVLPDAEPDEIVFAADVAFGGGDFMCMPIGYVYGMDVYIHDVVYSDKPKEETRPVVINAIMQNGCSRGFFEANAGGDEYAEHVSAALKRAGYHCSIETKRAPVVKTKLNRILAVQSEIKCNIVDGSGYRLHFLSRSATNRTKEYDLYIRHLTSFNQGAKFIGKQKDDAADATASLVTNVLYRKSKGPSVQYISGAFLGL